MPAISAVGTRRKKGEKSKITPDYILSSKPAWASGYSVPNNNKEKLESEIKGGNTFLGLGLLKIPLIPIFLGESADARAQAGLYSESPCGTPAGLAHWSSLASKAGLRPAGASSWRTMNGGKAETSERSVYISLGNWEELVRT